MAVTTTNLLMGPVEVWSAPFGTAEPANAVAAPATGWVDLGGTSDGVTLTIGQTYTPMNVDQVAMAVGSRKTDQTITVATNLAEATLNSLRAALNQVGETGTELELDAEVVNNDPAYQAIMLRGSGPSGDPRMVILRRTLSTEGVGIPFAKDAMTVVPITWTAYYVSSSISALLISDTPAGP
jgi:hypothetical protein